jgi:hypothetical protein
MFRHYPDALERATELDAQYGSNSPLDEMSTGRFQDKGNTSTRRSTRLVR